MPDLPPRPSYPLHLAGLHPLVGKDVRIAWMRTEHQDDFRVLAVTSDMLKLLPIGSPDRETLAPFWRLLLDVARIWELADLECPPGTGLYDAPEPPPGFGEGPDAPPSDTEAELGPTLNWRGPYNANTSYAIGDVVAFGTGPVMSPFTCVFPCLDTPPSESSVWQVLPEGAMSLIGAMLGDARVRD